jgi:thiol-disulfide isomerase/thioredoxin
VSLFGGNRHSGPSPLSVEGRLPGFEGATGWLNSPPLAPEDLRGKVVLVDFCTYTCINWLRTLGYVRAWQEKYRDQGFVVVGVHSPEFPFEHDVENVRDAVKEMRIEYPVALDSDFGVWRAFANRYWPAVYIADAEGRIRHHQFGEGGYAQCEMIIQWLLRDAGRDGVGDGLVSVAGEGFEAEADWTNLESPETYLGYRQAQSFASPGGADFDRPWVYELPGSLRLNQWAFAGDWTIGSVACVLNEAGGRIVVRFHARDVNVVLGPAARGTTVPFRVLVDGESPGDAHGLDVDERGNGVVARQRLYQLIREPGPIADRTFEIMFSGPGVEAYAFTFG